jgi:hypothetical protein
MAPGKFDSNYVGKLIPLMPDVFGVDYRAEN